MATSALRTALGMQDPMMSMPSVPGIPAGTPLQKAERKAEDVGRKIESNLLQQAEFGGASKQFEAEQRQREAAGQAEILAAEASTLREAEAPIRLAEEERMNARFTPTRETATEMAALYSLVGILGFGLGAGGKQSAMNAMSAMNGMLEGYREGSADRYRKEKQDFDTNLKTLSDNITTLNNRLQRVQKLATVDKLQAQQELSVTLAEYGADFVKENINKFGLEATLKYLQQLEKAAQTAVTKERDIESRAEQKVKDAALAREREKERQDFQREMQRERLAFQAQLQKERLDAKAEADKEKAGKTIGETQLVKIEGLSSISSGLNELLKEFKPEYAGLGILGFGADLELEASRRLGDKKGAEAARWWAKYNRLQAPNRHALFGATLTGNELKNYQSFTAKTSDNANIVKQSLEDQIAYSDDVKNTRLQTFKDAGYKLPEKSAAKFDETYQIREFNTVEEAEAANLPSGTKVRIGGKLGTVE